MKKPKEREQSQKQRFIETARAAECDEDAEAFDKAFRKVVPPKSKGESPRPRKKP